MSLTELLVIIGSNVRSYRQKAGLTLSALAEICGMEKASLSRIESGKINLTMDTLTKIAIALGVDIAQLFEKPAA